MQSSIDKEWQPAKDASITSLAALTGIEKQIKEAQAKLGDIEGKREELAVIEKSITEKSAELKTLETTRNDYLNQHDALNDNILKMESRLSFMKETIQVLEEKQKELLEDNTKQESSLALTQSALDNCVSNKSELENELIALRETIVKEQTNLQSIISQKQFEMDAKTSAIATYEEKLSSIKEEVKAAEIEKHRMLDQIASQVAQAQNSLEQVQQDIVAKHEEAHAVSVQIQNEIGAVQVELEGIESKKVEALASLDAVNKDIQDATNELNQLKLAQQKARNATTIALNEIQTVKDQALIEIAKQAKQKNVKLNKELLQGILTE